MKTLETLLRHSEAERDRCFATAQTAGEHERAAQAQYDQLLDYRRDYEARWHDQFSRQGTMELVQCYQGFMLRLSQAVEHQQAALQHATSRLEQARAALLAREIRVASVRKLIDRRRQRERGERDRREQKSTDESGARPAHDSVLPSGFAALY
jgi:flagellar protein FliJ